MYFLIVPTSLDWVIKHGGYILVYIKWCLNSANEIHHDSVICTFDTVLNQQFFMPWCYYALLYIAFSTVMLSNSAFTDKTVWVNKTILYNWKAYALLSDPRGHHWASVISWKLKNYFVCHPLPGCIIDVLICFCNHGQFIVV